MTASANSLQKLWCERENETIVLVDYADILWIEAQEKRVYVHARSYNNGLLLTRWLN